MAGSKKAFIRLIPLRKNLYINVLCTKCHACGKSIAAHTYTITEDGEHDTVCPFCHAIVIIFSEELA